MDSRLERSACAAVGLKRAVPQPMRWPGGVVMEDSEEGRRRRRHQRLALDVPVRISTIDAETDPYTGRPFFRASREWCANVSRGGVFVRTPEPLEPGRRVLLELALPDGTALEATGRVAWARRPLAPRDEREGAGIGIEFLGTSARGLGALERLLSESDAPTRGARA